MVAFFCSIAFIAYVQRLSISVTISPLQGDFALSLRQSAWLLAAFGWGYAVAQIPAGWLTDWWGVRKTLASAALIWSFALGMVAIAGSLTGVWLLWFIVGIAQSCVFSCATRGLRSWLPVSKWARANGGLTASMSFGGGVTTALTALLLIYGTWREIYGLYALAGIAWALLFWLCFRDEPAESPANGQSRTREVSNLRSGSAGDAGSSGSSTAELLKMPSVWALIAQQFFRCAPYVFFTSLFPLFLQQHRGMTLRDSGLLSSLPLLGTLTGCLVSGVLADRLLIHFRNQLASRRAIAIAGMALAAIAILSSLWVTHPFASILVMCVGTFGSAFAGVAAFTAAMDVGQHRVGTVFGLMNTAGNLAGAISPIVAGEIIVRWGNWNIIIALASALYLAAMASWVALGTTVPALKTATRPDAASGSELSSNLEIISAESSNARC